MKELYWQRFGRPGQERAYCTTAALTAEITSSSGRSLPTASLEFAPANGGGEKGYQWGRKTVIQLTDQELVRYFLMLVSNTCGEIEFSHHGTARDKSAIIRRTPSGQVLLIGREKGRALAVPLETSNRYWLIAQAATALRANHVEVDPFRIAETMGVFLAQPENLPRGNQQNASQATQQKSKRYINQ
jgi:hypothetical protein